MKLLSVVQVTKSCKYQEKFVVSVCGGSVSLKEQIEKLEASKSDPPYLYMYSKLGYADENDLNVFPWPSKDEPQRSVVLESKFIPKTMTIEDAAELINKEGFRSATLQELLSFLEQEHPAHLVSCYAIIDAEKKKVLVALISSMGWCFQPHELVLSCWAIPCVRK